MSGVGKLVAARFNLKDLERVEQVAKSVKKSPSRWLRDVALAELNGENRDPLGDLVRNMRMPPEPTKNFTCGKCGFTVSVRAKPVFVPDGMERPEPVFEVPACPKCTAPDGKAKCLDCGVAFADGDPALFSHACQGEPDHIPSGIALEQEMSREALMVLAGDNQDQYQTGSMEGMGAKFYEPPPRSWSSEWEAMDQMEPGEAMARFTELRSGRQLPAGFAKWPRAQMVAWLESNWPLV